MGKKSVMRMVTVVLVLAAIAYFAGAFDRDFTTVDVPRLEIEADVISRIEIAGVETPMSFQLVGGHWQMTEPVASKADSARVARLVDELSSVSLEMVVSTNPERYGRYGVDSTAKTVRVLGDGLDELFFIGESGPDFQTIFVRLGGDDRVFGTSGRIAVDEAVDRWRDKTVVDIPVFGIERVSVQGPRSFDVVYSNGWGITDGESTADADSASVVRWLRRFAPLRGDGFISDADADDEAVETYDLVFRGVGGSTQTLRVEEHEANLLIKSSASSEVFRLSKGRKASLIPEPSSLRPVE